VVGKILVISHSVISLIFKILFVKSIAISTSIAESSS